MRFTSSAVGALGAEALIQVPERSYAENFRLPLSITNGSAGVYSALFEHGAGSVQVFKPNSTSYEWWYFDAVSDDLKSSVVFQPDWNYTKESPLDIRISFTFEDGSSSALTLPGPKVFFLTVGNGVSAIAKDGSFSWVAEPDMSAYSIKLNFPEHNITGSMHYQSVTVDLNVNGSALAFQGNGYHDKNFAGFDFSPYLNQWHWGHGRSGELSVVWFYHVNSAGQVSTSAYIAKNNAIIHAACSGVSVRPLGKGVGSPSSSLNKATIDGYAIHIDAGSSGQYAFTATAASVLGLDFGYGRWAGTLEGGLVGGENRTGPAIWEHMGPFA